MEALRETSDELRLFPGVTVRLEAYAGSQCFPHTQLGSLNYRGRANEQRLNDDGGGESSRVVRQRVVGRVGGPVLMKNCWFQRCNDHCKKWRCVDPAVVDLLRGVEFLRPEATDLDWQLWLSDARTRYASAQQRFGGVEGAVSTGLAPMGLEVGDGLARAGAVGPGVDDGAVTPESEDGARTPSDGEVASEGDNPDAVDVCLQGSVFEPPRVVGDQDPHGQVALSHKQRRLYVSNTVKPLAVRRARTFSVSVVNFLVRLHGCRKSRLRIGQAESMGLWHGWCLMYPRLSKPSDRPQWESSVCKKQERLGWGLLELKARAEALAVPEGGNDWTQEEMDEIEQGFFSDVQAATVRFECSMLQSQLQIALVRSRGGLCHVMRTRTISRSCGASLGSWAMWCTTMKYCGCRQPCHRDGRQ